MNQNEVELELDQRVENLMAKINNSINESKKFNNSVDKSPKIMFKRFESSILVENNDCVKDPKSLSTLNGQSEVNNKVNKIQF